MEGLTGDVKLADVEFKAVGEGGDVSPLNLEAHSNITFEERFTLQSGVEYNYTIETGFYPQIHHNKK